LLPLAIQGRRPLYSPDEGRCTNVATLGRNEFAARLPDAGGFAALAQSTPDCKACTP
jgi:hypothetical protein